MWPAVLQVAVTPARTRATITSRASPAEASDGAMTSATDTARVCSPTRIRTQEDSPNQPCAGLSSVQGCLAESTARSEPDAWSCIRPKPRPITASPTSLTGSAPGTGHGQRSRTNRSAPVNSSMVVRQSTRSMPFHNVRVWV